MDITIAYAAGFAAVIVGGGLLVFWLVKRCWNLDVLGNHTGFFQAWISILQTVVVAATLGYIALQARDVKKSVSANTVQLMVTGHRELLGMMIDHPELYNAVTAKEIPDKPLTIYLSMLFNHGLNTWTLRDQGFIDDDWWAAIVRDMKAVYQQGSMVVLRLYPRHGMIRCMSRSSETIPKQIFNQNRKVCHTQSRLRTSRYSRRWNH